MKYFIKSLLPPILVNALQKYRAQKYGWKGDYLTWQQAKNASTGYDTDKIIDAVKNAMLKVKKGEAVYERDSVIFDKIQYSWPLLSGLLLASVKCGALKVVDFGGSLGTTYYQNKKFFDHIPNVSWNIIEQEGFVAVGKNSFEDKRLHFYNDVKTCMHEQQANVLIFSCVLQYIENPYQLLNELLRYNFDFVLLDLTAIATKEERLMVQYVNPLIYDAQYPCWLLDYNKIQNIFETNGYKLIERFETLNNYQIVEKGQVLGHYIGEIRRKND